MTCISTTYGKFRVFLIILLLILVSKVNAQPIYFKIGIGVDFGSHVKRIGLRSEISYQLYFVEANADFGAYYNFSSFGVQKKSPELQMGLGACFGFGKKSDLLSEFIFDSKLNNTPYPYALSYHYQIYLDRQQTSQTTGTIGFHAKGFSFLTENDLLGAGKGWRDRFRTAALSFSYHKDEYYFAIKNIMYTGDYASCTKITDDDYPARYGYRSNDKASYQDKSVGIVSVTFNYLLPYQQVVGLSLGIDAEQIRHQLQNKWMHDMVFYTDKMVKRQLMHIPMLQSDGSQYLFNEQDQIRESKFYYNFTVNPMLFY